MCLCSRIGFIGKGLTRAMNQIWNYFVKGFLGTVTIVFIFPILCIGVSVGSILLSLTSPIWVPFLAVLLHLFMMIIYDIDCPSENHNRYCIVLKAIFWNILIQGLMQPIAAILVAFIICPMISVFVFTFAIIRYWLRLSYDSIMFQFIRRCGRIPSTDSFVVKRFAGPGFALDQSYFSIKPEQALAALEIKMELDELQAFQQATEKNILQPQRDFNQFVDACFGPFSAQLSKSGSYKNLEREARDLLSTLHEKLEKRQRDLQIGLTTSMKSRIKMNKMELKIAIQQGAHLLERFYPEHIFSRISTAEEEFWESRVRK